MGTEHPMIMRAMEESLPWPQVQNYLDQFLDAAGQFDCDRMRELLLVGVSGYVPKNGIDDVVWRASRAVVASRPAVVTNMPSRRSESGSP